MRKLLPFLFIGVVGCGSQDSPSQGNIGGPGCTTAPECSACGDCYSLCVCSSGQASQCFAACGLTTAGTGGTSAGGSGGTGAGGGSGGTVATGDVASSLRITELSLYQGVKVPIMQNGGEVTQRNAPIVAGRMGLLRVFVTPDAGFQPREIVARLSLAGQTFDAQSFIQGASTDGNLGSTLNVEIPGAQIPVGGSYSVTLHEAGAGGPSGPKDGARFPAQGEASLGATSTGAAFDVVVVPIVVSGFTPDTSPARIETLKNFLFNLYPTPAVNITTTAPVNYPNSLSPTSGNSWNNLLNFLLQIRNSSGAPKDTYYYGMVAPASSAYQFCGSGCIAGLSPQASANDVGGRGSVGLGYFAQGQSAGAESTMAHELGHAQGLPHAPCAPPGQSIQGVGQFPYSGGVIGSWGYDLISKQLRDPNQYRDVMGYCSPDWISDFNFNRLATRIAHVNSTAYVHSTDPERAPGTYRTVVVGEDGELEWSFTHELSTSPLAEKKQVLVLDSRGKIVARLRGLFYETHHVGGGILFLPAHKLRGLTPDHVLQVPSVSPRTLALAAERAD